MVTISVKVSAPNKDGWIGAGYNTAGGGAYGTKSLPSSGAIHYGGTPVEGILNPGGLKNTQGGQPILGVQDTVKTMSYFHIDGIFIPQGSVINSATLRYSIRNYETLAGVKNIVRAVAGNSVTNPYASSGNSNAVKYWLGRYFQEKGNFEYNPFLQNKTTPSIGTKVGGLSTAFSGGTLRKTVTAPPIAYTTPTGTHVAFQHVDVDVKEIVQRLVDLFNFDNDSMFFDVRADPRQIAQGAPYASNNWSIFNYAYSNWSKSLYTSFTGLPTTLGSGQNVAKLTVDFTVGNLKVSKILSSAQGVNHFQNSNIFAVVGSAIYKQTFTNNRLAIWKSTDGGLSYTEQDAGIGPLQNQETKTAMCLDSVGLIHSIYTNNVNTVSHQIFDTATDTFGATEVITPLTLVTSDHYGISVDGNDKLHATLGNIYTNNIGGPWKAGVTIPGIIADPGIYQLEIGKNDIPYLMGDGGVLSIGRVFEGNQSDATSFTSFDFNGIQQKTEKGGLAISPDGNVGITWCEVNTGGSPNGDVVRFQEHVFGQPWGTWLASVVINPAIGEAKQSSISWTDGDFVILHNQISTRWGSVTFRISNPILDLWLSKRVGASWESELLGASQGYTLSGRNDARFRGDLYYQYYNRSTKDLLWLQYDTASGGALNYHQENVLAPLTEILFDIDAILEVAPPIDFNFSIDADLRYAPYLRSCTKHDALIVLAGPVGDNDLVATAIINYLVLNGDSTGFELIAGVINPVTGIPYNTGAIKNNIGYLNRTGQIVGAPYVPPPSETGAYNFKKTTWHEV